MISSFITKQFEFFNDFKRIHQSILNYIVLKDDKSKGVFFNDSDGFDDNNENLKKNFSYNQSLKYLSISVKNLSDLTVLIICRTKIKQIDQNYFRDMPNLKKIDFSFNKIEQIEEDTFRNLNKLEKIDLSQNQLRIIRAKTFVDLPQLKSIDLHYNEINTIEECAFMKVPLLIKIQLSFNEITKVNSVIFEYAPKLEDIDFHYNKINLVEFKSMIHLEKLDLSKNRLKRIDKNSFQDLPQLKSLNLTFNEIEIIELGSFCHNLPLLETLDLRSNEKLKKVDFLVLSLAEKKVFFDPDVKLVEYSRLPIDILLDLFSFYKRIEYYESLTQEIFFKLKESLFVSIDLNDFKYQNDHILSNIFCKRFEQKTMVSSFWVRVYDLNEKTNYSRNHKKIDSDLEMKKLKFRLAIEATNQDQLNDALNELLSQIKFKAGAINYLRSNSSKSGSKEACQTFFKSLNEHKWMN